MKNFPWEMFQKAQEENRFCDFIKTIPRDQWYEYHSDWSSLHVTWSLLHVSCQLSEYEGIVYLLKNGHRVDLKWRKENTLLYSVALYSTPKIFKLLLASGAHIYHKEIAKLPYKSQFVSILIENGYRLEYLAPLIRDTPTLLQLGQGVESCRNAIVVLLALKKRRRILPRLDKFLIQQVLAVEIWTTRGQVEWQHQ